MTTFNRDAHVLDGEDRGRIDCCRCDEYATMCEHSKLYTGSVAFYYYCSACWHTPGPNAPSPAERTGLPAPGVKRPISDDDAYMARDHLESIISKGDR